MYSAKSAIENRNSPIWRQIEHAIQFHQAFEVDGPYGARTMQFVCPARGRLDGLVEAVALHRIVCQDEIAARRFANRLDLLDVPDIRGIAEPLWRCPPPGWILYPL
jgi:hypothetical protein